MGVGFSVRVRSDKSVKHLTPGSIKCVIIIITTITGNVSPHPRSCCPDWISVKAGMLSCSLFQPPTKVIYVNQQVIIVDNMMIDARNSGIFLEDQRKSKKNPGPEFQKIHPEAKREAKVWSLCFPYPKFFGQEPHSWSKGAINNWYMLLLKYQLCVIIFKLRFVLRSHFLALHEQ